MATGLDLPIEVVDFNAAMARVAGELVAKTRAHGLSLGDRACLATALSLRAPTVLTADRIWSRLALRRVAIAVIR